MSARKAQKLDLGTVERRGQTFMQPEQVKHTRPFGLEEAPTFRPTLQEWRNPMEYMRSIVEEGSKYGIVKIIPPDEWNPDFAIDTEVCLTDFSSSSEWREVTSLPRAFTIHTIRLSIRSLTCFSAFTSGPDGKN